MRPSGWAGGERGGGSRGRRVEVLGREWRWPKPQREGHVHRGYSLREGKEGFRNQLLSIYVFTGGFLFFLELGGIELGLPETPRNHYHDPSLFSRLFLRVLA